MHSQKLVLKGYAEKIQTPEILRTKNMNTNHRLALAKRRQTRERKWKLTRKGISKS